MHPPEIAQWLKGLEAGLERRRQAHLYRELSCVESGQGPELQVGGQTYIQFCTNNYLGLASDPELIAAAREATARYGTGSSASRLVAGSMELHHQLEEALAAWKQAEAALVFPTGFMANLAVVTTFAEAQDVVVSDKLNHASLIDAAKFSSCINRTFPHRQYKRAGDLLERLAPKPDNQQPPLTRKYLVTDTVFSMDGDLADLASACDVAAAHGALMITDEAHATGVLGPTGAGLAELQKVSHRIALSVGTLSKALGSVGGFVTGPRAAIATLINEARPFIYTTALPPATSAAALAAVRIVQREPARRQHVLQIADHVRRELRGLGYDCGDSATPIIPVMMPDAATALHAAARLREQGLWVPAIRPPTVKQPRLRISVMATHSDSQIERLLIAMRQLRAHLPAGSA